MKIYVITITSVIDGIQRREVFEKAFITKESAKDAMNAAYKQWMSEAEKYDNITKQSGDDYFVIYNTFSPERFEVDYSIDEVELSDEDN